MSQYEDILKEIETTLGVIPSYIATLPKDELIQEWAVWKKYIHNNINIPYKYRALKGASDNKWLNIVINWFKSW